MIPMEIIARIRSDFPTKFGIPRQSGLVEELRARPLAQLVRGHSPAAG